MVTISNRFGTFYCPWVAIKPSKKIIRNLRWRLNFSLRNYCFITTGWKTMLIFRLYCENKWNQKYKKRVFLSTSIINRMSKLIISLFLGHNLCRINVKDQAWITFCNYLSICHSLWLIGPMINNSIMTLKMNNQINHMPKINQILALIMRR